MAELDRQSGKLKPATSRTRRKQIGGTERFLERTGALQPDPVYEDGGGGASRFFPTFRYQAKSSRRERAAGLPEGERNTHPTCKPVELMRWLVRLVCPPNGTVLDPFLGSGTTGIACTLESFEFIGIEREAEYVKIAEARIAYWRGAQMEIA